MSEEIDLDANNLIISVPEDAFEKFQSSSAYEEDEFITLSDIVPPQPSVPDHSQELNEIPYDNEVVLGSPQNYEGQVNSHIDTAPELLDISENNVFGEYRLDSSGEGYSNNDLLTRDLGLSNGEPKQQNVENLYEYKHTSDGLGAQNYVIQDTECIIQDSLLSTTVSQSDTTYETTSKNIETSSYPRRTKRGRIPNTAKYPITSASDSDLNKTTPGKRRPGRPKKAPAVQLIEPDSTNVDNTGLLPENGSITDGSGLDESTPYNEVRKRRRGRPSSKEDIKPTPSKRGRKPKAITTPNKDPNNSLKNEDTLSQLAQPDVDNRIDLDSSNNELSTSKRKKRGSKKGIKASLESADKLENTAHCDNNSDLDDDADDLCLSILKQGLIETETISNTDVDIMTLSDANIAEAKPIAYYQTDGEDKPTDKTQTGTKGKPINDLQIDDNQNNTDSKLTGDIQNNIHSEENTSSSTKRNSKMTINSDFEYNVDKVVKEATTDGQTNAIGDNECLLVEDTSKRRRTAKKAFVYDEGSDEDPFANVESSDDEPKRRKKGNKYNSDDEYVPSVEGRKKGGRKIQSSSSESEDDGLDELDDLTNSRKINFGTSPFKKGRKPSGNKSLVNTSVSKPIDTTSLVSTIAPKAEGDDIEGCLETTMIKIDESLKPPAEAWATSNEFENFIAQKTHGTSLKIKKVSSKEVTDTIAPLDIPVVHQNEPKKKTVEISTQTKKPNISSLGVQTSAPYDIPMKANMNLTAAQSEKACEFLTSVVKTTVELGQLMSQKSDDFMKKKINTEHVTDTFKMDYCVRKSFLLFKLAKHNLLQMEEDLANQYDAFLREHNLSSCREVPKKITPKVKPKADSDSDCEIVEVVGASGSGIKKEKSKFNPKTVFLNKELSIKIAKKPSIPEKPTPGKKKLEIKGRHAVWINKNVMVKKVTPTQSFLAQDSRNKKPPDFVTEKMVSDFFEGYNRTKALFMCAPFISTDWTGVQREYACHYFMNELDAANTSQASNDLSTGLTDNTIETSDEISNSNEINDFANPKSLFSLCIDAIRKCLHVENDQAQATQNITCDVTDGTARKKPVALFRLCVNAIRADYLNQYIIQEDTVETNNVLDLPNHIQHNTINTQDSNEEMDNLSDQYNKQDHGTIEEDNIFEMPCKYNVHVTENSEIHVAVLPLTTICYKHIAKMLYEQKTFPITIPENISIDNIVSIDNDNIDDELVHQDEDSSLCASDKENSLSVSSLDIHGNNGTKSLITLCVELIQSLQKFPKASEVNTLHPNELKSLKSIAFESIKHLLYPSYNEDIIEPAIDEFSIDEPAIDTVTNNECETNENFTINCVNTLSEEAFQNLQIPLKIRIRKQSQDSSNFSDGFDNDGYAHHDLDFNADHEADVNEGLVADASADLDPNDNGWASQLQMQEFRSCYTPHVDTTENMTDTIDERGEESHEVGPQIKSEPVDYFAEENIVYTSIVKTEPLHQQPVQGLHALNEMTHIPDSIITKKELTETTNDRGDSPLIQNNSSFNVESFEQFVRSNKMIQSMDETNDEIFSQSGLRVRRQHEPDLDQGHDTSMSLLVPHTFEPLQLVEAKGVLMESSSDNDSSSNKKNTGKKKDKRKKKTKKDTKAINSKETPVVKEKTVPEDEVAVLTRRMREKIRQEEKKIESSESDSETLYMLKSNNDEKIEENKKDNDKLKLPKNKQLNAEHSKSLKQKDDVVQCNNVDSTEKGDDSKKTSKEVDQFSGFTAIDQNEITNYQKLMQFVYDKIIPSDNEDIDKSLKQKEETIDNNPIIHPDEPVELLECEPTMPMFDNERYERPGPMKSKNNTKKEIVKAKQQFTNRHGWHCYPINSKETKLYKNTQIKLEKLPESFVETYMEYQDVMDKDLDDHEVDRLINLQSLNRSIGTKDIKDGKLKTRPKGANKEALTSGQNSANISRSPSPTYSDNFDELAPSDDEGPKAEDEIPPPMPARSSENNFAKNLLMDDHDSDSDNGGKKVKQEPKDPDDKSEKPLRPGPKSKTKLEKTDSESLMLTADKMMNKELTLLHAPILLQDVAKETTVKETSSKEETKTTKRSSAKHYKDRVKNDDDSSSEEEKQWVSTKEKLLKRMGKKEDAIADDAKRAKLVNEFIERRNEDRKDKRESGKGRKGRARRKMLERQKQLRFLSNELYEEGVTTGKRGAAAGLFKGRRNIRKVIGKESLTRSTVVANMEEFERKRRLNMRQNKLREVLGCEEGVNVLVINDEVCLEYDFEEQRPVVTVHQFFTKVMKAHQYEGVKFMWDACFESLGTIEGGHGGGGCILAHCMGLGKTLQVLALLHTVLTHPRANMHRVLVCCPLSTVLNWVDEIHKWIGPVTHEIKVFELSKLRKTYERAYQLEDWYSGGGIFIIGYELFRSLTTLDPEIDEIRPTIINKIRTALLDPGPDIIVCDEGHLLKNDCSVLAVAMSRVVTKRRIVLTGTPMQNNLREYFCMVNFIKPNLLGTYSEYSNRFENPIMNGQHRDSREEDIKLMKARTHILHKVLEGCLQRQEASVLYPYLPKKHEYTVFIPLTQCQWELYNHYMDNYAKTTKQSVLRDYHILQKLWSHPQVLHSFQMKSRDKKDKIKAEKIEDDLALADQEADIKPAETEVWWLQYLAEGVMLDSLDSSNKFVAVFRILHECVSLGDKVLIFSTSLFCLDALEFFLKKINKWSLGQEYYRLDGSVPAEVRQKWCREFNAENNIKTKLFLISTRAGCLGLNMTAANRVIILDTSWNPAHDIQSIFRVYRFGQKKDCYIYRLVALGTMEQKIYERSVTKQAVACRVVDEQQIDRHYNLAELTELYSVDEMGLSVAGGVAVGVGDVVLLRVARDAAIHAVHEHDSLLRGSGEQGLPEHERAAAWNQFQQEHENKQKQNDLNANKAVVALKRLEMEHLRQQALYSATIQAPPLVVKMEHPSDNFPLLVPKEEPGQAKNRGRKPKVAKIVQCRIPIATGPQPGPSIEDHDFQQDMVQKITNLLIKHNFMNNKSGPRQIADLVAKVKKMVATKQPIALGPGYDELSSSIANVLLQNDMPMPPLTDVEPLPMINIPDAEVKKRGRPKKEPVAELPELADPEQVPSQTVAQEPETDGRKQRKAALVARMNFDLEHDVIDLDDDGGGDDWQQDTEAIDYESDEPQPAVERDKQSQKRDKTHDSSILLSDDEAIPEVTAPVPTSTSTTTSNTTTSSTTTSDTTSSDNDIVPLHPSLLTNSNFIKIVAHTYLAGNPMMDEDAATLAAQYSTLKTLKESESEGKLIESGPVYDIAVQVLGKDVLRKLHVANPKTGGDSSSLQMQSLLQGPVPATPQTPAVKKPKIGPRSKVMKAVKQEPTDAPEISRTHIKRFITKVVKLSAPSALLASNAPIAREESILPDEEVIIAEPTPGPSAPVERKPIILRRVKLERKPVLKTPTPAMPVSLGRGPAPQASNDTICLDSDEEESAPCAPPTSRRLVQMPTMAPTQSAPVPVALTGPNSRPLPLPPPLPNVSLPKPTYYTLSPCGTQAILLGNVQPVPVAMTGPAGALHPVPVSLLGPGSQPVPMSFAGPAGSQAFPTYSASGQTQPVPISLMGPNSQPIPMSLSGPGIQAGSIAYRPPTSQPVPMSLVDSSGRPIAISGSNRSLDGNLPLRLVAHQAQSPMTSQAASTQSLSIAAPAPAPATRSYRPIQKSANATAAGSNKMIVKPDELVPDVVGILNRKRGRPSYKSIVTHTIDDEPAPAPTPVAPRPAEPVAPPPPAKMQEASASTAAKDKKINESARRARRRNSSSSSSSSGRSRSSSPDPLSILKDVVHIQAPTKPTPAAQPKTVAPSKPAPPQKSNSILVSNKTSAKKTQKLWKTDAKAKNAPISESVDLTEAYIDPGKSKAGAKKQISESVDLTNVFADQGTKYNNKNAPSKDTGSFRVDSSKSSGSLKTDSSKQGKTSTSKHTAPSKLVGTSKSIILDGKSKSLKVENKHAAATIQVTSSKMMQSSSTNKQKQVDKRPASSSFTPTPKKKKTELMTLKDFDIDDIDDIIELD